MIVVYTSPGCASCRKVKQWLKDRNLKFIEKNIFSTYMIKEKNCMENSPTLRQIQRQPMWNLQFVK